MVQSVFGPGVVKGTGSRRGPHWYETAASCARKAYLLEQKKLQEEDTADPGDEKQYIGTLFHAAMKAYHTDGALSEDLVLPVGDAATAETREALRLYQGYQKRFTPEYFGKALATELEIGTTEDEADKLEEFFGGPLTGQCDLLVDMSLDDVKRLSLQGLPYLVPGLWIVDFKTMQARPSSKDPIFGSSYLYSLQGAAYITALRVLGSQVQGFIIAGIVRHKTLTDESFFQLVRPYLPGRDEEMVKRIVAQVTHDWDFAESLGGVKSHLANPSACHGKFNKPCVFLNSECSQF